MTRPLAALAVLFALSACAPSPPPGAASAEPAEEIGLRLLAQDQPEMALRAFNRAMAAADGPGARAKAMTGAGVAMIRLGRMTEAARTLEAAVALAPGAPGTPVTLNALGVASYAAGRPEEALAAFRRAEALAGGEDPAIRANIALAEAAVREAADVELDEFDYDVIQYGHGVWRLAPRRAAAPEDRRP